MVSKNLADIFKKGYGTVSKNILSDTSLSLESKAIYAYFCALAGSGNTTFPYRSTILKQLRMSKNAYYKHLKLLIKAKIISVSPPSSKNSNTYTIVPERKSDKGYGIVSREIMQDPRLSVKAKGLYAYLCALSGKSNCSFPKTRQILNQLNISEPTYHSYMNQLKECGYVFVAQRKLHGRFSRNDYHLYEAPKPSHSLNQKNQSPRRKNKDRPDTNICDTPHIKIEDTKIEDAYLIPYSFNNTCSNIINHVSSMTLDTNKYYNGLTNFMYSIIDEFFPHASKEKLSSEFLPYFCKAIKEKQISNISAYMKTSIKNFLQDIPVRKAALCGQKQNQSYDINEIERLLDMGLL